MKSFSGEAASLSSNSKNPGGQFAFNTLRIIVTAGWRYTRSVISWLSSWWYRYGYCQYHLQCRRSSEQNGVWPSNLAGARMDSAGDK